MRRALAASLLLAALAAVLLALQPGLRRTLRPALEAAGLLAPREEQPFYRHALAHFERENARLGPGCVALVGDSLVEAFPHDAATSRGYSLRGISGDRVRHVADRLQVSALDAPCETVFLLAGSNDLVREQADPDELAAALLALAQRLRAADKRVLLSTLPPVRDLFAPANAPIRLANAALRGAAGRDLRIFDLHALLVDADGLLAQPYSSDGLHLTPLGYGRWLRALDASLSGPTGGLPPPPGPPSSTPAPPGSR